MSRSARTIEYLQRFAQKRKRLDFFSKDSDIERLRRLEKALYSMLILTFSGLLGTLKITFGDREPAGWFFFVGFLFLYFIYLAFEFSKVQKSIDLFLKNGVQSVEELLDLIPDNDPVAGGDSSKPELRL